MRRSLAVVAALGLTLVPGCLTPYTAHVDAATLQAAELTWRSTGQAVVTRGMFGPNVAEVDYTHAANGNSPPYPGLLQVFSQRELSRRTTDDLLGLLHSVVDNATAARGIRIDDAQRQTGLRHLASGLETRFFVEEGVSTEAGLFPEDTKVRILGEVGYDADSNTAILLVGIAQVESTTQCPILGPCNSTVNLRTWIEMVGDPPGTITGASAQNGLAHHLVTHG